MLDVFLCKCYVCVFSYFGANARSIILTCPMLKQTSILICSLPDHFLSIGPEDGAGNMTAVVPHDDSGASKSAVSFHVGGSSSTNGWEGDKC